ncbi:amidohydrolase family protein [Aestuariibius sp. 2305UL40-4]|uniref:amidohydrolase family protein n=1 Tax=Aestuariibius violaceus TaxID=3234132 RepID=UPI00345E354D
MTTLSVAAIWARPWEGPPVWGGQLTFEDGRIGEVTAADPEGDALLIPGLINAHDHGRGLRPLAFGAPDGPLEAWLWDLWRAPPTDPYLTALVAFGQMALSGVTTVVHNHLPQLEDLLIEAKAVARAARDVGIRLAFVVPILDRNLAGYDGGAAVKAALPSDEWTAAKAAMAQRPFAEQIATVSDIASAIDGPDIVTQYGPPGPQWLSPEGLAAVGDAAATEGRRVHIHLLETQLQRDWMDATCPDGAHFLFDRAGLLNDRLTVAHGVFLRSEEATAFADASATLVLNTSSNLRLSSGIADGAALKAAGLRLGIGLDGMALDDDADMLREMRLTSMLLGPRRFDRPGLGRADILRAAYSDGRVAFNGRRGDGLAAGAEADVVSLSFDRIARDRIDDAPKTLANLILGRACRATVRDVWVAGRQIVKDAALTGIDLTAAERELTKTARASRDVPAWIDAARAARVAASTPDGLR